MCVEQDNRMSATSDVPVLGLIALAKDLHLDRNRSSGDLEDPWTREPGHGSALNLERKGTDPLWCRKSTHGRVNKGLDS